MASRLGWVSRSKSVCGGIYKFSKLTGAKVDEQIEKEYGVGAAVEDDPPHAVVVVEERYCNWQNDEVADQKQKHGHVPIEPGRTTTTITTTIIN